MPEPPAAVVAHAVRGRTRIRIESRRGDGAFLDALAQSLGQSPLVRSAVANPVTGSLLIHHQGNFSELTAYAAGAGLFTVVSRRPPSEQAQGAGPAAAEGDQRIAVPDGWQLLALCFVGLALVQLVRGRVLSPALTLGWYALAALRRGRLLPQD